MRRLLAVAAACAALIAFVVLATRPAIPSATRVAPEVEAAASDGPTPETLADARTAVETPAAPTPPSHERRPLDRVYRQHADIECLDVWLRIVDRATGAPLAIARVERDRGRLDPPFVTGGACDENGWLRLRIPPSDESAYRTRCGGFGSALFMLGAGHEQWPRGKVVELDREAVLGVTVATPDGRAVPGVELVATVAAAEFARDPGAAAAGIDLVFAHVTDNAGRAAFDTLPANAQVSLRASLADFAGRASVELPAFTPGERRELSWTALDAVEVVGRLLEADDTPLRGSAVWLVSRDVRREHEKRRLFEARDAPATIAITDANGSFRFERVQLGSWWIGPGAVDGNAHDLARSLPAAAIAFEVVPRTQQRELVIRVEHAQSIFGRVVDSAGVGVAGRVRLNGLSEIRAWREVRTEPDGRFDVGPLPRASYELVGVDASSTACSRSIVVEPGARDLVLRVGNGAILRGRTIDAATGELLSADVLVLVVPKDCSSFDTAQAVSSPTFEIAGLHAGTYCVSARCGDQQMALAPSIELAAGSVREVTLALERCARVRLVNTHSAQPISGTLCSSGVMLSPFSVSTGSSQVVQVPPGPTRVEFRRRRHDHPQVRELVLASGEEIELELGSD